MDEEKSQEQAAQSAEQGQPEPQAIDYDKLASSFQRPDNLGYGNRKIIYVDPQTNERYSKLSLALVSEARVIRIDNQQFTEYARNAFTRQRM